MCFDEFVKDINNDPIPVQSVLHHAWIITESHYINITHITCIMMTIRKICQLGVLQRFYRLKSFFSFFFVKAHPQ